MQEFFEKNKNMVIVATVVIVILVGAVIFMSSNKGAEQKTNTAMEEPTEAPIPTVDSSVIVEVNPIMGGKEVDVVVKNAPSGTESIDVELSYNTKDKGLQGAIGTITVEKNAGSKKITLGTCSSGTCVYHQVDGEVKVDLKFNGSYGEQLFTKNYKL
jgi:preprotein translocase subunit SecF